MSATIRHQALIALIAAAAAAAATSGSAGAQLQSPLRMRVHVSGLLSPVAFVQDPTDRAVQFVVQQGGRIRAVRNGALLPTDFLDLRAAVSADGERGLLGLAFAPDYATSGRFFVNFTNTSGDTVGTYIAGARWERSTAAAIFSLTLCRAASGR